ncbi:MAG: hypothetical protein HOY71_46100, partial [Nonomuraea sp.]|nr:hypothetical protein [Nonomuraea sp.]
ASAPVSSAAPTPSAVPTADLASARLPGTDATIYEHASDPIRLTQYSVKDAKTKDWTDYPRASLTGTFTKSTKLQGVLSPDGRFLAERPLGWTGGYDAVIITDKVSGESFTVKTSRKPLGSYIEMWSRDSRKILLDMGNSDNKEKVWQSSGFIVVDVTTREAKLVSLRESSLRSGNYGFDGTGDAVVIADSDAKNQRLRFFDDSGARVRVIPNIGGAIASEMFSPSGQQFATTCPGLDAGTACVYDAQSGAERARFESKCNGNPWWFDETHLTCWVRPDSGGDRQQIQVLDFNGKMVRLLADIPTNGENISVTYTYTRK